MKKLSGSISVWLGVYLVAIGVFFMVSGTTAAVVVPTNWLQDALQYEVASAPSDDEGCVREQRLIEAYRTNRYGFDRSEFPQTPVDVCVYTAGDVRYASYVRDAYDGAYHYVPTTERGLAVALGDGPMVPVSNIPWDARIMHSTGSSFVYAEKSSQYSGFTLKIYRDLASHLQLYPVSAHYNFEIDQDYETYSRVDGTDALIDGLSVSPNGRWLSFVINNFGLMRMDLQDGTVKRVIDYHYSLAAWPSQGAVTAIANDGGYIVLTGTNVPFRLVVVGNSCGEMVDRYDYTQVPLPTSPACPDRSLNAAVDPHSHVSSGGVYSYSRVYIDETSMPAKIIFYDSTGWGSLRPVSRLYYLALGDSYASGEGDVTLDGVDHYLTGTNVYGDYRVGTPRETCHISPRSYPMRIANALTLTKNIDMNTVACAGAVTTDILATKHTTNIDPDYLGQRTQLMDIVGPRLQGIPNAAQLQDQARSDYTPGRVQQIEFVKKTQPMYMTVMIGGNDLDFGGVMLGCAKNALPSAEETCDYAKGEGFLSEVQKVQQLYPKLLDFYAELKSASPQSNIYVIGYPQFIDEHNVSCAQMANLFTRQERHAISSLIAYANAVIEHAAHDAGVKYIDISRALTGGKLCDGGIEMTGIEDVFITKLYSEYMKSLTMADSRIAKYLNLIPGGSLHSVALRMYLLERATQLGSKYAYSPATAWADVFQELGHPNALGHQAMFEMLRGALGPDLLESSVCDGAVICPDGTAWGAPRPGDFIPEFTAVVDEVSRINGNGVVTIGSADESDGSLQGVLSKGSEQRIDLNVTLLDGVVDEGQDVSVEIHSDVVTLGQMHYIGGKYVLRARLPESIKVGQHVLHIKGWFTSGERFDIDMPVFVQGPATDIDDDGVANDVDSCAFGDSSGIDRDADGIDDVCDLQVDYTGTDAVLAGQTKIGHDAARPTQPHQALVDVANTTSVSTLSTKSVGAPSPRSLNTDGSLNMWVAFGLGVLALCALIFVYLRHWGSK